MEMLSQTIIQVRDLQFELFLSAQKIQERVDEMGAAIRKDYADKNPILISVLNGAFIFAADLMRSIEVESEIAFTRLASYDGLASTGEVNTLLELDVELKDRHIIIVEDIVDTGKTLHYFLQLLQQHHPASISVAALLVKPEAIQHSFPIQYIGFSIPNKFVVGYGLDYNSAGRQLKSIYQLRKEA